MTSMIPTFPRNGLQLWPNFRWAKLRRICADTSMFSIVVTRSEKKTLILFNKERRLTLFCVSITPRENHELRT